MNGRKAKALRRQKQERNEQLLADARQEEPWLLEAHATFELWQRGRFTFYLPVILDDLPDELKQALAAHRTATLDGSCPLCEVTVSTSRKGLVVTRHEDACPGHPDRLVEIGERVGVEINRKA
ncbi:hypothetical protein OH738_18120 [Streptomyces hirsutus]|uniref:hypothetical protein n=1 Tax=Streptomyces hirsutus TaxID=35620 RepID=UPI00386C6535|nr:hypothetical protein OH738_18120 [Streptomyces hirsutus]